VIWHKNMVAWTKAEKIRIEQVLALGCCICGFDNPLEVHHLLLGGRRMGNYYTICLCAYHHRHVPPRNHIKPVTLVQGSKPFTQAYGTQRSLWEATQRRLGLECNWPDSKLVPRRLSNLEVWD
jgi:Recombination enhancement, RecA-dependent nuclease